MIVGRALFEGWSQQFCVATAQAAALQKTEEEARCSGQQAPSAKAVPVNCSELQLQGTPPHVQFETAHSRGITFIRLHPAPVCMFGHALCELSSTASVVCT